MPADRFPSAPVAPPSCVPGAGSGITSSDPLDDAVLNLAVQAAFLQGFAENLFDEERPVAAVLPKGGPGETDFGWRATVDW